MSQTLNSLIQWWIHVIDIAIEFIGRINRGMERIEFHVTSTKMIVQNSNPPICCFLRADRRSRSRSKRVIARGAMVREGEHLGWCWRLRAHRGRVRHGGRSHSSCGHRNLREWRAGPRWRCWSERSGHASEGARSHRSRTGPSGAWHSLFASAGSSSFGSAAHSWPPSPELLLQAMVMVMEMEMVSSDPPPPPPILPLLLWSPSLPSVCSRSSLSTVPWSPVCSSMVSLMHMCSISSPCFSVLSLSPPRFQSISYEKMKLFSRLNFSHRSTFGCLVQAQESSAEIYLWIWYSFGPTNRSISCRNPPLLVRNLPYPTNQT